MGFEQDTALGGPADRFPTTRRSLLAEAATGVEPLGREAFSAVAAAYWKPVYKYIRRKWNKGNQEAKDLTQGFFVSMMERSLLANYDSSRAAFRTYVRTCVDGFVKNEAEASSRLKRGGGIEMVALDFDSAERELALASNGAAGMEDYFQREWLRGLFELAVDDLRRYCGEQGKPVQLEVFERYDLAEERPTYEQLATALGIPVTSVTNHLAWARRELRRLLLDRLSLITGGESEFNREARFLLGWEKR